MSETSLHVTKCELLGKLPDPFLRPDGTRISDVSEWKAQRETLKRSTVELQYGTMPPEPEFLEVETLYRSDNMNGFLIHTGTKEAPVQFRLQVQCPAETEGPFPVIVIGDHCWAYVENREYIDAALSNGIAWAFFDRTELAHDVRREGRSQGALYKTYPEYTFGAIGAWAWGYSRVVDALQTIDLPLDLDWIAFAGHSRGAKTAALAGALDERARIVHPNSTCAGACGCYRIHMKGVYLEDEEKRSETLDDLMSRFGFWMGPGMEEYRDREQDLPFDAHFLKALVAPRTLYISEALGDLWANPVGSLTTTLAAREVYRFLGAEEHLYWSFREGYHGHRPEDIARLVAILRHERDGELLPDGFGTIPFDALPDAYGWRCPGKGE